MKRFIIYIYGSWQTSIFGIKAKTDREALETAKDLFNREDLVAIQYKVPSGWKESGGLFYTKNSKYGVNYMCKACGRKTLGIGLSNHYSTCTYKREDVGNG